MSNNEERSSLDYLLKGLDKDVIWSAERKERMRQGLSAKLNQTNPKGPIRIKLFPTLSTLLLMGIFTMLLLSNITNESNFSIKLPATSGSKHETNQFTDDNQNEVRQTITIEQLWDSGFDLRLPSYSLEASLVFEDIVKIGTGPNFVVTVGYYLEEKKLFNFVQESFTDTNSVIPGYLDYGIDVNIEETKKQTKINGRDAYISNMGSEAYSLLGINMIMDHNVFTVSSDYLTEDELIEVVDSINLSGL